MFIQEWERNDETDENKRSDASTAYTRWKPGSRWKDTTSNHARLAVLVPQRHWPHFWFPSSVRHPCTTCTQDADKGLTGCRGYADAHNAKVSATWWATGTQLWNPLWWLLLQGPLGSVSLNVTPHRWHWCPHFLHPNSYPCPVPAPHASPPLQLAYGQRLLCFTPLAPLAYGGKFLNLTQLSPQLTWVTFPVLTPSVISLLVPYKYCATIKMNYVASYIPLQNNG